MFWSYLLTTVGVLGLYLVGSKKKLGWMVGIFAQVLWIAYALATHQYGFIISAFAYGWVYVRGLRKHEPKKITVQAPALTLDSTWYKHNKPTKAERQIAAAKEAARKLRELRVERPDIQ